MPYPVINATGQPLSVPTLPALLLGSYSHTSDNDPNRAPSMWDAGLWNGWSEVEQFVREGTIGPKTRRQWREWAAEHVDKVWVINGEEYQRVPLHARPDDQTKFNNGMLRCAVLHRIAAALYEIEPRLSICFFALPWYAQWVKYPVQEIDVWMEEEITGRVPVTPWGGGGDRREVADGVAVYTRYACPSLYAGPDKDMDEWEKWAKENRRRAAEDYRKPVMPWLRLELFEDAADELRDYLTRAKNIFPHGVILWAPRSADATIWQATVEEVFGEE